MTEQAWSALVTVYQSVLHDVVGALESDAGMDSGVFSALAYVAREGNDALPLSELQRLLHPRYSQPGVSRLVQRMEADGLVVRRTDPDDKRASIVSLTSAGRTRYRKANEVYEAAVGEHFARHLTASEARSLVRILDSVGRRGR
ncbi:MAG TPA: MarR family transcriptional regulator [Acidimicrobiia bacterium]|nr:MarR family transcriptional regulator [Acidimicrobiia bacterium]